MASSVVASVRALALAYTTPWVSAFREPAGRRVLDGVCAFALALEVEDNEEACVVVGADLALTDRGGTALVVCRFGRGASRRGLSASSCRRSGEIVRSFQWPRDTDLSERAGLRPLRAEADRVVPG